MPTRVDFEGPVCQENMDEPVYAHEKIVRDLAALALDRNLRFLSRAESKLDRVIAKCFVRLKQGTYLLDLGYVRFRDYIDECVGRAGDRVERAAAREARERRAQVQRFLEDDANGWAFLDKTIPAVELTEAVRPRADSDDAWALHAKVQRAIHLRQRVGACMGRMLYTMANRGLHRDMQFASMGHYAVERLGMSARTCRAVVARQGESADGRLEHLAAQLRKRYLSAQGESWRKRGATRR